MLVAPIAGVLVDRWDKRKVFGFTHVRVARFQFLLIPGMLAMVCPLL
jgi:hypothetical protein